MSRNDLSTIRGRVVAVTGGARGIGAATARALADAGATVVIGDLDLDRAEEAAAEYAGTALPLDVASRDSFAAFLDEVVARHGRLDALVNNAGFMVIGAVQAVPLERQLAQVDVNLTGVIQGCYLGADRMRAGGVIVNIASLAGRIAMPGGAVYSATKFGVLGFTEALDAELRDQQIRVCAVLPSFTNTELIEGTRFHGRLMQPVEPADIAAAVLRTIARPRPITTVPAMLGASGAGWNLTASALKPWLRRRFGLDSVFTDYDETERAAYIARNRDREAGGIGGTGETGEEHAMSGSSAAGHDGDPHR